MTTQRTSSNSSSSCCFVDVSGLNWSSPADCEFWRSSLWQLLLLLPVIDRSWTSTTCQCSHLCSRWKCCAVFMAFTPVSGRKLSAESSARSCSSHDLKDEWTYCYERKEIGCLSAKFMKPRSAESGNASPAGKNWSSSCQTCSPFSPPSSKIHSSYADKFSTFRTTHYRHFVMRSAVSCTQLPFTCWLYFTVKVMILVR